MINKNKEFNLISFLLLFTFIVFPDQFLKLTVNITNFSFNNEIISFFSWEDDSFFLNLINGMPKQVTQIFSGIITIYLSALLFGLIYFLKNKNLFYLKAGITGLFLSTISNFIDMTHKASVTLIFHFKPLSLSGNYASITKYLSIILIIAGCIIHLKELRGKESRRKTFLINPSYQLRTSSFLSFTLIIQAATFGLFSYFYFNSFTFNFNTGGNEGIALPYLLGMFIITILFIFISFFVCVIYTQKTVGPLVAFERFIDDLIAGKDAKLYLRDGDHLQELERLSDKLRNGITISSKITSGPPPLPKTR
jgi:signal peptidase II